MRTFSILIGSALLVAAFGSATMAEEVAEGAKDCAGHYNPKTGPNFGRCPGMMFDPGIQGTSAGGDSGAGATGGTGSGSGATGGNR